MKMNSMKKAAAKTMYMAMVPYMDKSLSVVCFIIEFQHDTIQKISVADLKPEHGKIRQKLERELLTGRKLLE